MCGIVSYFGEYSKKNIVEEIGIIKHRGKDDTQYLFLNGFGCGFVRLSIIDLANGTQPISNESNTVFVICNGEIYNYKSLTESLVSNGHVFKTKSDIEVVIHLYEEYGKKCINYLEGMYAFVIYDKEKRRIVAGRDHIGIKPLFYEVQNNHVHFASELKVFKSLGANKSALLEKQVFGFVIDTASTLYNNVKQIQPGQVVSIDCPHYDKVTSYDAEYKSKSPADTLEESLLKAVETHLTSSDVEVGIALSGGLDSSLIAVLCKEIKSNIKTFTISNRRDSKDIYYAKLMAERYGFNHTEIIIKDIPNISDLNYLLDGVLNADLSGTFDNIGDLAVFLFYKEVSKHVKVILSGDGSDELFGGYWMHKWTLGFKDKLKLRCNDKNFSNRLDTMFPENNEQCRKRNVFNILYQSALPNYHLWTLDRCSMRHGVEARVPYLDINVVRSVKKKKFGKKLIREIGSKYLPEEIINRSKEGFCDALVSV